MGEWVRQMITTKKRIVHLLIAVVVTLCNKNNKNNKRNKLNGKKSVQLILPNWYDNIVRTR